MKKYKHIYIDLDRTIWDFDKNTATTLTEMIKKFGLNKKIPDINEFIRLYHKHNDCVWKLYRMREISKEDLRQQRFRLLLNEYNVVDNNMADHLNSYYMDNSPRKGLLIEGALDLIKYLYDNYNLYIVSNGFYETQLTKLKSAKIDQFFTKVFTSDKVQVSKPDKKIFGHCLSASNAKKAESILIGDDLKNDIEGARKFGIDQIWLNTENKKAGLKPTYEVNNLYEIKQIL